VADLACLLASLFLSAHLSYQVRSDEYPHGSHATRIGLFCHLQYLLGCDVDSGWQDREDDGPAVLDVGVDHIADEIYILIGSEGRRGDPEDTRHVDNGEVLLFRSADLDLKGIDAKGTEVGVGFISGHAESNYLVRILDDPDKGFVGELADFALECSKSVSVAASAFCRGIMDTVADFSA
jgi:hypothetical protein